MQAAKAAVEAELGENGRVVLRKSGTEPLLRVMVEATSEALCDNVYTLAYLHHLMRADEILALQICSIHNLAFYLRLMGEARQHIALGDYMEWYPPLATQLMRRL